MFFPGVVQPCPGKASWKTRTGTLFFRAVGSVKGGALKMAGEFLHPHPIQLIQLLNTLFLLFRIEPNNQGHLEDCAFFEAVLFLKQGNGYYHFMGFLIGQIPQRNGL